MGFVKVIKTKSYFSRYQVKYKRRRQCKTDYYARKRLIIQDKNKYGAPKYRFVVRFSNKDVIVQIFKSTLTYDKCMVAAYSHELTRYGVKLGLTNYAAAYCTGLLAARRLNKKIGLDEMYPGNTEDLGEYYEVEPLDERNPFCCLLDVGLKPTTTGSRMFGALKGAVDGGLDIPHGDRRYPRPKGDGGRDYEPDAEFHKKYIFGGHVAEYMTKLKDEDEEAYKKQFGRYIKEGIEPEDLEGIYEAAHKAIRENPTKEREPLKLGRFKTREKPKDANVEYEHKKWPCHPVKLTIHQRKQRIRAKLKAMGKTRVYKVKQSRKSKRAKKNADAVAKKAEEAKMKRLEERKKNKVIAKTPRTWEQKKEALKRRAEFMKQRRAKFLEQVAAAKAKKENQ